ncbi:hypothetical protein BSLA_01f2856 [Burkholderia stabilis]|nr:hypothetical protein BSLA_01f2856 [Burkholderia stabilis]
MHVDVPPGDWRLLSEWSNERIFCPFRYVLWTFGECPKSVGMRCFCNKRIAWQISERLISAENSTGRGRLPGAARGKSPGWPSHGRMAIRVRR